MKIGLAKECITPTLPVLLAGFGKERNAHRVADDVYVKIVVYKQENIMYGVISYDLVGIDDLLLYPLKKEFIKLNLDIDNFLVAATHTHSAQGGILESSEGILKGTEYIFMPTDKQMIVMLVKKTIKALLSALEDMKPSHLFIAKDHLTGIGSNRNNPAFNGNDDLMVIYIEQEKGKKAILVNFACHPTVLNQENLEISADFPGALHQYVCEQGYSFSMFLNGSCGDISTRFTKVNKGYQEIQRFGAMLSEKVLNMRSNAYEVPTIMLSHEHLCIDLKLKKADTIGIAKEKLNDFQKAEKEAKEQGITGSALRSVESYTEGAKANLIYAKNAMHVSTYTVKISIYRINDEIFICIPGELFSQLSNCIQNENIHFITYANGYHGYFADEYAYEARYYEALSSPFEKGQSEYMMSSIKEAIVESR